MGARSRRKPARVPTLDKDRAFEILFQPKMRECVRRWLERLGVPLRDREDIAQDVFVAAHQSFHTYDPRRARPERWLNKITVHVAAHYHDKARHRREALVPIDEIDAVDDAPNPDERIGSEQERHLVLEFLQSLDGDLRAILLAHDVDGIPMTEIAEQHGRPLSTMYKWRARALAAFARVATERLAADERALREAG